MTGKHVSVIDVFRRADRWALEEEPHEKGFLWDPDLMHAWANRTHAEPGGSVFRPEKWHAAIGVALDAKDIVPPSGEIFRTV